VLEVKLPVGLPLVEISAKTRCGGPIDEAADIEGPYWGGHDPIRRVWGASS
jgi:hypothetical protein